MGGSWLGRHSNFQGNLKQKGIPSDKSYGIYQSFCIMQKWLLIVVAEKVELSRKTQHDFKSLISSLQWYFLHEYEFAQKSTFSATSIEITKVWDSPKLAKLISKDFFLFEIDYFVSTYKGIRNNVPFLKVGGPEPCHDLE